MKKYAVLIDGKFVITFIIMFSLSIYAIFQITKNIKILPEESKQELRNLKTTFTDTFTDNLTDTDTGYNYENNSDTNIQTYNTSSEFPEDFINKTQHLFKKDFPELNHNKIFYGSRCMYCGKILYFSERLFNYGKSVSEYDIFYSNGKNPKHYERIYCEYCNKDLDLNDICLNRFKIIWE